MVNWQTIDTVLLDMDGTLLDLHFDNHFWQEYLPQCYAASRDLDVPTAKAILSPIFRQVEGTLSWYCLDYWSQQLALDIALLKRDVAELIALKPYAIAFLDALRGANKRTVLVTNAHRKSLALKLEHTRIDGHLDRLISAHDLGWPKESDAFWQRLHNIEPFNPSRTLLIDDTLSILRAARTFGISQLLAVSQPSSSHPRRATEEFAALENFSDIMPFSPDLSTKT